MKETNYFETNAIPEVPVMDNWLNSDLLAVIRHRKKDYIRLKYQTASMVADVAEHQQKLANLEAYIEFLQRLSNKSGEILVNYSDLFIKEGETDE